MPRFSCSMKTMWLIADRSRGVADSNPTVTATSLFSVTLHVVVLPAQPPPIQLDSAKPGAGASVSVTVVPLWKEALQDPLLQLIPAGLLVTLPDPEIVTVS